MTITTSNDSVTYKSPRGDTERPADLVVTLPSDGAGGTLDPTLPAEVVGSVAHDGVDAGKPVKIGGKANNSAPTAVANADRVDAWFGLGGQTMVGALQHTPSDATSNTGGIVGIPRASDSVASPLLVAGMAFNGTSWDRERSNQDLTAFTSAARTATPTPFDGTNYNGKGLHLVIDCTAVTSSPSVVFTIQGKDALSGKFYTILASAAIVGTGTTVLRVYPGLTVAANLVASDILPRSWRLIATHGNADSITYSVGYSLVL